MTTQENKIVLIGLMGAGKTTIGRRLAKEMGLNFVDSDDEIAKAAGCSIPDLFSIHGEDIFRDLEERVIKRLLKSDESFVMATGGGAWISDKIRKIIKKDSVSVWLKADLDVLLERVSKRNNRPLLEKGDKQKILQKLIDERYPIYEKADIVIESNDETHSSVVGKIVAAIRDY